MPRKYPLPPLVELSPGILVTRNTCVIDASKAYPENNPPPKDNRPEEAPENPRRQNDAEGGPVGSTETQ